MEMQPPGRPHQPSEHAQVTPRSSRWRRRRRRRRRRHRAQEAAAAAPAARRPRKPEVRISQLILQALSARRQRGGLSLASLRRALLASGYDVERNKARVQTAIRSLVKNGSLVQTKATGSLQLSGGRQAQEAQPPALPTQAAEEGVVEEAANPVKKPRRRRAERKAKARK